MKKNGLHDLQKSHKVVVDYGFWGSVCHRLTKGDIDHKRNMRINVNVVGFCTKDVSMIICTQLGRLPQIKFLKYLNYVT